MIQALLQLAHPAAVINSRASKLSTPSRKGIIMAPLCFESLPASPASSNSTISMGGPVSAQCVRGSSVVTSNAVMSVLVLLASCFSAWHPFTPAETVRREGWDKTAPGKRRERRNIDFFMCRPNPLHGKKSACIWRLTCFHKNTSGVHQKLFRRSGGQQIFNISIKESRWQGNVLDRAKCSLNYLYYSCLLWSRRKMTVINFKTMKHGVVTFPLRTFSCSLQAHAGPNSEHFCVPCVCLWVEKQHALK